MTLSTTSPTPADLGLSPQLFPSFREGQLDLATRLAFSPSRFRFLQAPCGAGKSTIYLTTAALLDLRLLILTPQKALQDQLMRDFGPPHGDLADVRGQKNYDCPKHHNCEIGAASECPLRRLAEGEPGRCLNLRAIDHARRSKRVVTNHAFWMTQGKAKSAMTDGGPPPGIGTFDLLVLDEGHGTPERLADFCSISVIEKEIEQLLDLEVPTNRKSLSAWSEWAQVASSRIPEALRVAGSPKERFRLVSIGRDMAELSGISSDRETEWIYQYDSVDGKHVLSPVWATAHAERLLFQNTPQVVLTSATLLPSIGKYLGIESGESEYIEAMNGFDPARRPFIYTPSGVALKYNSAPSDIRVLTAKYDQIIDLWRGYRGLIQSQSYDLQMKILANTRNRKRLIICERGGLTGAEAIDRLKREPIGSDKIVIGPGLKEGHDLPDDCARFQIIAKMPLVNRTDPVVDARCKSIPEYSMDQTSMQLQQATGRITRSKSDWGFTYTGDEAYGWVRKKAPFPESFRRAERIERERVPGPPTKT